MKKLYNPTNDNFTITYDTNGDGNPLTYVLHAGEAEVFEDPVADHILKHLAYQIAAKIKGRGSFEDAFERAKKQIIWTK